jgi:hypothetical protein
MESRTCLFKKGQKAKNALKLTQTLPDQKVRIGQTKAVSVNKRLQRLPAVNKKGHQIRPHLKKDRRNSEKQKKLLKLRVIERRQVHV